MNNNNELEEKIKQLQNEIKSNNNKMRTDGPNKINDITREDLDKLLGTYILRRNNHSNKTGPDGQQTPAKIKEQIFDEIMKKIYDNQSIEDWEKLLK
jgi:dynactin complex subunit